MNIDEILIEAGPGETRIALMADARLTELVVARDGDDASLVGNVYLGRVERVLSGIAAAFVDIGLARAGFLGLAEARPEGVVGDDRIADYLSEGDAVLVQVQRDATADKGTKLTTHISLTGRSLVFLPGGGGILLSRRLMGDGERARLMAILEDLAGEGEGFILRTAGAGANAETLGREVAALRATWAEIERRKAMAKAPACLGREPDAVFRVLRDEAGPAVRRIVVEGAPMLAALRAWCRDQAPEVEGKLEAHAEAAPLFEARGVEAEIEAALAERVALPSGGSLIIQPTAALIAIDVNTGGHAESGGPEETALQVNLEAADEIARQLRMRNLAGAFAVDFVPMKRRPHQADVLARLRAAVAADRVPTHVLGYSPLGLVEMTRQRRSESLAERLTAACPACAGTASIKNPVTVAAEILRRALREAQAVPGVGLAVTAAPAVVAALKGPLATARCDTEARLGAPLKFAADAALAADAYTIMTTRDGG